MAFGTGGEAEVFEAWSVSEVFLMIEVVTVRELGRYDFGRACIFGPYYVSDQIVLNLARTGSPGFKFRARLLDMDQAIFHNHLTIS